MDGQIQHPVIEGSVLCVSSGKMTALTLGVFIVVTRTGNNSESSTHIRYFLDRVF